MEQLESLDGQELDLAPESYTFIDRLSWIFIIISGFCTFYGIYSYSLFLFYGNTASVFAFNQSGQATYASSILNWLVQTYLQYQIIFSILFFLGCLIMFFAAIGLKRRKRIAKSIFIKLLYLHILYCLLRMLGILYFMRSVFAFPLPESVAGKWNNIHNVAQFTIIAYPIYCITLYFLYRWIHRRLNAMQAIFN
ncbi:MAG: hypothetical protein AB8G15_15245 [Saprospiraceae bacterium]